MNPYVKIAIAAMAAVYIAPPLIRKVVATPDSIVSEVQSEFAPTSDVTTGLITGAVTAVVFALLGVIGGGPVAP